MLSIFWLARRPALHLRYSILLTAGLALGSCNQTPPPAETAAPAAPTRPPVPGPDLISLSDSNAVALLTEYGKAYPASEVIVHTRLGDLRVKLYDDTPIHKANFLLLARKGVFDETVFNRVVNGFAIQGGQSDHRTIRIAPTTCLPKCGRVTSTSAGPWAWPATTMIKTPTSCPQTRTFTLYRAKS
ncbi:peptidylprolyl isomerase [Hymenobacter cellulosilyticus]|uniref:peptidylprolyl isomerase n=1 Tax=Hymenobacter cellulosilyticus TaxID=2932248 RepID=UPI0021D474A9|nr:peptidylprolyl isomerase [Hymenobacter cellulosilyticus]